LVVVDGTEQFVQAGRVVAVRDFTDRATTYSTVPTAAVVNGERKSAQASAIGG